MLTLMLISPNAREKRILQMAFEQHQIKVIEAMPDRASYIKALQYSPDFVIMEFPPQYTEQLNFSKNIFAAVSKKKKLLMLGYGQEIVSAEERAIKASGIKYYMLRPLKFSLMMKYIEDHLGVFAPEHIVWKKKNNAPDDLGYIETLLNLDILPTVKLEILSERIQALLAFPFTVLRVLQLTEDSKSGANDLAKVITADPVISANILKMANTVFFASRNRRITTIHDSIVRIGFTETKHLTMTMSVMNTLDVSTANIGFDRLQFWHHSLAVAVICQHISKDISGINSSEMYLAGLLHSFGIILLDEFFPEIFEKFLIRTTDRGCTFIEAEQEMMVVSHLDLTFRLFEAWKIPHEIVDSIRFSEKVSDTMVKEAKNVSSTELTGLILYVADIIAKSQSFGNECDMVVTHVDEEIFSLLRLKNGITKSFIDAVNHEVEIFRKFLKIEDEVESEPEFFGKKVLLVVPPLPFLCPLELYLKRIGFEVIKYLPSTEISDHSEQYTFVVHWFQNSTDEGLISELSTLRDVDRNPITSIVVSDSISSTKIPKRYDFENKIDLRLILITIQEIISENSESE